VAYDFSSLNKLLTPQTVAVVGASANPIRIGGRPISSMLKAGFKGTILPVNPNRDEIQGLPCYKSVADLPGNPDSAIVAVPAVDVIPVIEELGKKGCGCVTLFSAGFAELGDQGRDLQVKLIETVKRYGIRLLGPNTLGSFNALNGYYGTFSSSLDSGYPIPGNIGIASQSGAYGTHLFAVARNRGLGASVLVATGNEADITVGDAIGWMAQSDEVEVICAYLEGFNEPDRLLEALELARGARKPVFVMKVGRSTLGAAAAQSHTATLTGDDAVADAVLAEYGAIRVDQTEDMLDFAYCAHHRIYPSNNTMGFITISGGGGIVASDEAETLGLSMPPMPEDAQKELKELLPISSPVNPLDATAQAINEPSLMEVHPGGLGQRGLHFDLRVLHQCRRRAGPGAQRDRSFEADPSGISGPADGGVRRRPSRYRQAI
jgi:acyl-CoA synthetase (NDP forming)